MNLVNVLKGIDYEVIQGKIDVGINKINYDSRNVNDFDQFAILDTNFLY